MRDLALALFAGFAVVLVIVAFGPDNVGLTVLIGTVVTGAVYAILTIRARRGGPQRRRRRRKVVIRGNHFGPGTDPYGAIGDADDVTFENNTVLP